MKTVRKRKLMAQKYRNRSGGKSSPTQSRPPRRARIMALAMTAVAMQATTKKFQHNALFDTDAQMIGVDNRASGCISDTSDDFEGQLEPTGRYIKGFGGVRTYNVMKGTLVWKFEDDQGRVSTHRIPNSYYIPEGKVKLLSPQHWARTQQDTNHRKSARSETYHDRVILVWNGGQSRKTIPLDRETNVATFALAPGYSKFAAFCAEANIDDYNDIRNPLCLRVEKHQQVRLDTHTETDDEHVLPTQKKGPEKRERVSAITPAFQETGEEMAINQAAEYLRYHIKFNHIPTAKLQEMARQGIIPRYLAQIEPPVCTACMYGKATRRPWRHKRSTTAGTHSMHAQAPGDVVSVDQLISPAAGLIAQMSGWPTNKRYRCATVFVDHFSDLSYVHPQRSTGLEETIAGKEAFERYARQRGVTIQHYHSDNGVFRANGWMNDCAKKNQGVTFAGVNAHHQNGRVERRIRTLQEATRTILIHATKRWPEAITTALWPYAMRMANDAFNAAPNLQHPNRWSPEGIFSGTSIAENSKHWYHFGCPVYVLNSRLQNTGGIQSKWKARSTLGIYLGRSPIHARNIALVLDPTTGYVSPQFHVKMDTNFTTVQRQTRQENLPMGWQVRTGFYDSGRHHDQREPLQETWQTQSTMENGTTSNIPTTEPELEGDAENLDTTGGHDVSEPRDNIEQPPSPQGEIQTPRRSQRPRRTPQRLIEVMNSEVVMEEVLAVSAQMTEDPYNETEGNPIVVYKATADPDSMYLHQAMQEPDREEFKKAMIKEVEDQLEKKVYVIVEITQVPRGIPILPAVWQMRRKRHILTREIYKWKARCNIDGSKQVQGRDFEFTYAPVAGWPSVRLLLILTLIQGWYTVQLDYVQAYPQAPVERDIYMQIPKGFVVQGEKDSKKFCLKLLRNIYGQCQASRVWNLYLVERLKKIGFKQSEYDQCIFYRGRVMYILYTDDSILAGPTKEEVHEAIKDIEKAGLEITIEGTLSDFIGVNITREKDGTIHLSQPQLINQILKDLRMEGDEVKIKRVPMKSTEVLKRHRESPKFDKSFHYRSVIGKLNYLEKGTRADISYAVHQCARYAEDPRKEHGDAIRWLGRYLKGTHDKGTWLRPDTSKGLEVYVDASFVGDWDSSNSMEDRDTARSRYGYVIMYAGCPITWKSQLATEICLSTTEAEFVGLSAALREAIPIMNILKEMKREGFDILSKVAEVKCKLFEDNSGALEIAKVYKSRPRTKHINVKLWHFMDYVLKKEITLHACRSEDMPADILTKPVNEQLLQTHRRSIMGWTSEVLSRPPDHSERECNNS